MRMLFIIYFNSMIEESKFCTDIMKKNFNKELVRMKILETLLNFGFVIMFMVKVTLK